MTKKEFANTTAKRYGLIPNEVEKTIDALVETAKNAVRHGDPIHIRGFGSLGIKQRKAKLARNIKAGTTIAVPAHKVPFFKPSPEFKALLK